MSGQPWSSTSGDPLSWDPPSAGPASADPTSGDPYQPPRPPAQPTFRPGYAALPQPPEPQPPYGLPPYGPPAYGAPPYGAPPYGAPPNGPEYPPTTPFEAQAGQGNPPPGYPPPYGPPPRRRSNIPLIALILAVTVLLCGGAVTAGVMVVNAAVDRAKEAVKPITEPTLPQLPTDAPNLPGLPTLPTDVPELPSTTERTITVTYEVTGDGPAQIGYVQSTDDTPKRITDAKLPWKMTTTMQTPALVLVTAIRADTDSGSISCQATIDGDQVAQSSRAGDFATVTCSKFVLE